MSKWIVLAAVAMISFAGYSQVIINEIMYHPSSENVAEEYIELHNRAATNVNISGWKISSGVQFTFPSNTIITANGYLVVAAHRPTFQTKYPAVANVVGDWLGILSNSRNDIDLDDANGNRMDSVEYADEGDWAVRGRELEGTHLGWIWVKEHDGLGKSLELVNPALPNEHGQNWLPSITAQGTPGAVNSVLNANIAPMILEAQHFPVVPSSSSPVTITARLLNETASNVTATLSWRISTAAPEPAFTTEPMFDDGAHGDGSAGDGLFGAIVPAHANNAVIEFYIGASDAESNTRTWPAPALDQNLNPGQFANALYQVDDNPANAYGGTASQQPVYKVVMTEIERERLRLIPSQSSQHGPNSQMNATFISHDATGVSLHYLVGIRNRGHASRSANPPNYRVNFRSDDSWQGVTGINLNSQQVHIQHFGSVLANKSGSAGNYSRPVQVRINNQNRANSGSPMFGSYAANEVYNTEWAARHFPNDSAGNIYKQVRDFRPPDFDYRITSVYGLFGPENKNSYTNTFYKETNVSEDDWTDLIGMLRVMGINGTEEFTEAAVRQVINVDQWLTHLAVMCLMGNHESGLNDGHNDDYYMYRGVNDPRFILMHHDLDQILGFGGSHPSNDGIFGMMNHPPRGSGDVGGVGLMMQRFLSTNYVFRTEYLQTLQRLLDTTFSQPQFDALVDQTLGSYVPVNTMNTIKNYMNQRRAHVQGLIVGNPAPGLATITGEPRSPTPSRSAVLTVGGNDIVSYRFKLNNGSYGGERLVSSNIVFNNTLPANSTNTIYVIGKTSAGGWQSANNPTISRTWIVNSSWPAVRINEVLARNVAAINHNGQFPDVIELHNEGTSAIDLSGMRLTDDPADPDKYTFPPGTSLAAGAYLSLYADDPLPFALNNEGDGVYLFHRASSGGALLDSVQFGAQLPDRSIGRINGNSSGSWVLCQPTDAAANVAVATGGLNALRINEILTFPQSPFADDFIEIYNPSANPVDIGGLYLTDAPIGAPTLHRIPDFTFIPGNGYFVFIADGQSDEIDHVNFQLSTDLGEVALIGPGLRPIDCVIYGPQRPGAAYGRCPNGASTFNFLLLPTPGSPNACPTPPPPAQSVTLIGYTNSWRYDQSGSNRGTVWREPGFDDSGWPFGPGLLAAIRGGGTFPEQVLTPLTVSNTKTTFYFRAYFNLPPVANFSGFQMTHIVDDGAVFYINGQEVNPRYNMPSTPILATTLASGNILDASYVGPTPLSPGYFVTGTNVIAVEVHQANPGSADIALGLLLEAIITTNSPTTAGIRINEVLANNGAIAEPDGSTPDWVEFYNPSDFAIDLVGMSVSDSTLTPDRFVFPPGSLVPARGYFSVRFDADRPPSATNTGFGLSASGDRLHLFAPDDTVFDFVHFGIQAADFSLIRVGSSWQLGVPTIGSTNLAATLGDVTQVRINEWMADPPPGDDDWFELYNPNPQPVAIGGLHLTDDLNDRLKHPIAPLSFLGANTNAWQKFVADGNINAGADHVAFNLRAAGEAIGFFTALGAEIDKVTFGQQTQGVSEGRLLDGAASIVGFPATPSPGDPNYVLMNNIVINEVLTHTDLPLEDAIEIRNIGPTPVNISGWWLSDSRGLPRKYQITNNSPPIPAGGFRVFYEYQFNDRDQTVLPFSLSSAKGDEVFLSASTNDSLTGARAQAEFDASENGVSFGRFVNSQGAVDYPAMRSLSLGTSVTAQSPPNQISVFRTGQGGTNPYPKVGPLVISEIMYHPPDIGTNDNLVDEFVEIHNPTTSSVPLYDPAAPTNRWRLRDGVDFDFPPARSISPGGYLLVVSFDPTNNPSALASFRARYPSSTNSTLVGPYSGRLDNGGEGIKLQKPDVPQASGSVPYVLVDYVAYSDRGAWPTNADGFNASLQRRHMLGYANDPTNWLAAAATPGPSGSPDTDGDGLPDSWEQQYFGSPVAANPNTDSDGDGMTNLQEYLAGTHPVSAASRLRINPLTVNLVSGHITFQFGAVSNKTYTILQNNSLSNNTWTVLMPIAASSSNRTYTITDPNPTNGGQRFYRVSTP